MSDCFQGNFLEDSVFKCRQKVEEDAQMTTPDKEKQSPSFIPPEEDENQELQGQSDLHEEHEDKDQQMTYNQFNTETTSQNKPFSLTSTFDQPCTYLVVDNEPMVVCEKEDKKDPRRPTRSIKHKSSSSGASSPAMTLMGEDIQVLETTYEYPDKKGKPWTAFSSPKPCDRKHLVSHEIEDGNWKQKRKQSLVKPKVMQVHMKESENEKNALFSLMLDLRIQVISLVLLLCFGTIMFKYTCQKSMVERMQDESINQHHKMNQKQLINKLWDLTYSLNVLNETEWKESVSKLINRRNSDNLFVINSFDFQEDQDIFSFSSALIYSFGLLSLLSVSSDCYAKPVRQHTIIFQSLTVLFSVFGIPLFWFIVVTSSFKLTKSFTRDRDNILTKFLRSIYSNPSSVRKVRKIIIIITLIIYFIVIGFVIMAVSGSEEPLLDAWRVFTTIGPLTCQVQEGSSNSLFSDTCHGNQSLRTFRFESSKGIMTSSKTSSPSLVKQTAETLLLLMRISYITFGFVLLVSLVIMGVKVLINTSDNINYVNKEGHDGETEAQVKDNKKDNRSPFQCN